MTSSADKSTTALFSAENWLIGEIVPNASKLTSTVFQEFAKIYSAAGDSEDSQLESDKDSVDVGACIGTCTREPKK